eukprot:TRINITY_DN85556_c0_g1_i1.p2 TRINITY_DN85556_c0_g1~~TRINITY_DN85556_c0_g1_i1.p2  ORF type:complete len:252 (-),score=87.76 TRINITY_DN85556_c0_g1_i1:199-954(-)
MKTRLERTSGVPAEKRHKSKEATPTASSATSGGVAATGEASGGSGGNTSKAKGKGGGKKKDNNITDDAYMLAVGDQVMKDAKAIRELRDEMFTTYKFPLEQVGIKAMKEMGQIYAENTRGNKDHGFGQAAPHLFLAYMDTRQAEIEAALVKDNFETPEEKQAAKGALECLKAYFCKVVQASHCKEEVGVFRCLEEYNGSFYILTHNLHGKSRDVFMQVLDADKGVVQMWGMAPPSANERLTAQYIRNRRKR